MVGDEAPVEDERKDGCWLEVGRKCVGGVLGHVRKWTAKRWEMSVLG